jgi:hypothetical protein
VQALSHKQLVFKVLSIDQQHQCHVRTCQQCRFMGPGVVVHACNPSSQLQAEMGESGFEASLGKSTDPILQKKH